MAKEKVLKAVKKKTQVVLQRSDRLTSDFWKLVRDTRNENIIFNMLRKITVNQKYQCTDKYRLKYIIQTVK